MPRPKSTIPSYRKHKASGQAYVRINGQNIYLGKHNSSESKEQYQRLLAENPSPTKSLVITKGQPLTVAALVAKYVDLGPKHDSCPDRLKSAIKPLLELYATLPAQDFGPLKLKAVRSRMIDVGNRNGKHKSKAPDGTEKHRPLAISYINPLMKVIVRIFRWGVSQELVPVAVFQSLETVENLTLKDVLKNQKLKSPKKVKPVSPEYIQAVLPHLLPEVAAMVQLQLVCPLRPDELTIMRPMDIDTSQVVWKYTIGSRYHGGLGHKTDWIDGEDKVVYLGPHAQAILTPLLATCPDRGAFLFSPKRAVIALYDRRCKRPENKVEWKRNLRDRYNHQTYWKAVTRACELAGVPKWTPNQLRHTGATLIREELGLQAAQVALGHRNISTTQIYAEKSEQLQREVASKMG